MLWIRKNLVWKSYPTSDCCNAPVIAQGFTSSWYECTKCKKKTTIFNHKNLKR